MSHCEIFALQTSLKSHLTQSSGKKYFSISVFNELINVFNFFFQIQDKFDDPPEPLTPVRLGNLRIVKDLEDRCGIARNPQARELFRILRNPHFKVSLSWC